MFKGGPGSGCGGPNCGRPPGSGSGNKPKKPSGYREQPAGRYPGKPRAGIRPADLFPHGRNPDGTPRTPNDPKPAPKKPTTPKR